MAAALGIDVGTTGCKVVCLGDDGTPLATASGTYPLETPEPGAAELDPVLVWGVVRRCVKEATASPHVQERPAAVAIATAGEALIPLDAVGRPLGKFVTSVDTRSAETFRRAGTDVGYERLREPSGLVPLSHYTIFRWRWFAEFQRETYARTAVLAGHAEWLAACLGAERRATDTTIAIRSLAYRTDRGSWDDELLGLMGIDPELLPEVVPPSTVVGTVHAAVAAELGLSPDATIVLAGLDQACAAFALALPDKYTAMLSIGTTAVLGVELPETTAVPTGGSGNRIPLMPHVRLHFSLLLAGTPAGGALLRWFYARLLELGDVSFDLTALRDHATGVLALPHLAGSRVAFADPNATGALIGLRFSTTRPDVTRALMDGVGYELAVMAGRFRDMGAHIRRLRAVGGASQSEAWMQVVADVLELPIESTESAYAAAAGAAALAIGGREIDRPILDTRRTTDPRPSWSNYHGARLDEFKRVYHALNQQPH